MTAATDAVSTSPLDPITNGSDHVDPVNPSVVAAAAAAATKPEVAAAGARTVGAKRPSHPKDFLAAERNGRAHAQKAMVKYCDRFSAAAFNLEYADQPRKRQKFNSGAVGAVFILPVRGNPSFKIHGLDVLGTAYPEVEEAAALFIESVRAAQAVDEVSALTSIHLNQPASKAPYLWQCQ